MLESTKTARKWLFGMGRGVVTGTGTKIYDKAKSGNSDHLPIFHSQKIIPEDHSFYIWECWQQQRCKQLGAGGGGGGKAVGLHKENVQFSEWPIVLEETILNGGRYVESLSRRTGNSSRLMDKLSISKINMKICFMNDCSSPSVYPSIDMEQFWK